ncbi:MAG: hypothetical protein AAFY66_14595, partial [Pseudomonadota bacterium]
PEAEDMAVGDVDRRAHRVLDDGHVVADGESLGGQNLRVRYSANTKKGSSGAAVLNHKGALVAIHHAGDPNFAAELADYNQGIPIALIAADLAAAGLLPDIAGAT